MERFLYDEPIKPRSDDEKQSVVNRLKRIEGQVRGIQKMVDEDRYCIDILVQIKAINSALNRVGFALAKRHMDHCVRHALKTGDGDEAIKEFLEVMDHFTK